MARKRKLDATLPNETLDRVLESENATDSKLGGMWGGSAMNMMRQRIEEANASLIQGVLAGSVAISLDPGQVKDDVGSDRHSLWKKDDDFQKLISNIKRRGQMQPIRVRPATKDWRPSDDKPLETNEEFVIQSGRRRLEACKVLGIKVQAIVATPQADQMQADLEERFHENTMRRDLNGFEELVSIGALARFMTDKTQQEIADHLGVAQGDISLGLACLDHQDQILREVDIADTPKRAYRAIIPKLKRGESLKTQPKKLDEGLQSQRFDVRGIPMKAKIVDRGFAVNIDKAMVSQAHLEPMLVDLAKVVMKYQLKKK